MYRRSRSRRFAALTRPLEQRLQVLVTCTIIAMFAAASLQALHPRVAHAATTNVFLGRPPGDQVSWTDPRNWSLGRAPIPDDDVIIGEEPCGPGFAHSVRGIPAGTVIHGLTLQCGGTPSSALSCQSTIDGTCAGDLTVTNTVNWTGGILITPLSVPAGGVVSISGAGTKSLSAGGMQGAGVLNLAGSTTLSSKLDFIWSGFPATVNNTGTFTAQPGTSMVGSASGQFRFNNQGSFVVPPGPGVVLIRQVSYDDSGSTTVGDGSNLELQAATSSWSAGATFSGDGRTLIDYGAIVRVLDNVVLGSGHTLELGADAANRTGTMSGDGTLSGTGAFVWSAGSLLGNLSVASTTVISGPATKTLGYPGIGVVLNLAGITALSGPGALALESSAVLNNTGTFTMRPGASVNRGFSCCGRFSNAGTLVNDSGSSTNTINSVELANTGTIQLMSGVLRLNLPSFSQPAGANLLVTIGGTRPGTDFGQLQVSGAATLGGNLLLTNASGFIPTPGQAFQVLTCGQACNGQFAAVSVNYKAQYNPRDVTLIPLTSIALDPPDPTIAQGTTQQFTATGTYGDGSSFDLSSWVTWVSQDATIATIDQTGLATGGGTGTTTISATADTITGTTSLTVVSAAAPSTMRLRAAPAASGAPNIGFRRPTPPPPTHPARPPARSHTRGHSSVPSIKPAAPGLAHPTAIPGR